MQTNGHMAIGPLKGKTMNTDKAVAVVEEKRSPMHISLSAEDKRFLKVYAAEHDTTVAAVIAECVEKLKKEAQK